MHLYDICRNVHDSSLVRTRSPDPRGCQSWNSGLRAVSSSQQSNIVCKHSFPIRWPDQGSVERQKATCRGDDGPRCHRALRGRITPRVTRRRPDVPGRINKQEKKKGKRKRKHGRGHALIVYIYVIINGIVRLMFDGHSNPEILHILYREHGMHLLPRRRRPLSPGLERRNNNIQDVPKWCIRFQKSYPS